ncbi:hypothetical protein, partial [Glycomyces tenuis]|uniref:hypothetical protein n=1 Tax=Glycomyces tenuis TaxID=58116 RepID=UPI00054D86BE
MAVGTVHICPVPLDDDSIPVEQRIIVAERLRPGTGLAAVPLWTRCGRSAQGQDRLGAEVGELL